MFPSVECPSWCSHLSSIQKVARRAVASTQSQLDAVQAEARERDAEEQAAALRQEADNVAKRLSELSMLREHEENRNGVLWNNQQMTRQAQIEGVIRAEVEKQRARQTEQERLAKEEAERIRKEAEKAAAEEQRKKEAAAKAAREAEEAKAKADQEAAARKEAERMEQAKAQALEAQATERNALGMTTPGEDWREARLALKVRFLSPFDRHHHHLHR
jgi:hypothetical protein